MALNAGGGSLKLRHWRRVLPAACLVALALFAPSADAAYAFRRQLTIQQAQIVGGPHVDFPVLVSITDPTLRSTVYGGNIAHAMAWDVSFKDTDGVTPLESEIETFDPFAGTLVAWVKIPSLSSAANKIIFMDYGDCTVTAAPSANVWTASYRYVYHLSDRIPQPLDSTGNTTAVLDPNADATSVQVQNFGGKIGRALDLRTPPTTPPAAFTACPPTCPGTDTHLEILDGTLNSNQPFTMQAWVRFDAVPGAFVGVLTKARESGTNWAGIDLRNTNTFTFIWQVPDGNVNATTVVAAGNWYHVVVTTNGVNQRTIYVNGAPEGASAAFLATGAALTLDTRVGDDSNGNWMDGQVDELRVSTVARSAQWIATEYNNQNTPALFMAVGAETGTAPAACGSGTVPCAALATTATVAAAGNTDNITITAPGAFETVFENIVTGAGATGLTQFYDLAEDPGRVNDLAGGTSSQRALFLDEVDLVSNGLNYRPAHSQGRVELVEATPTRTRVWSDAPFQRQNSQLTVGSLRGVGEYSILPSGRMAVHWTRGATIPTDVNFQQIHLNVHLQSSGILSGWGAYSQSGAMALDPGTRPGNDDFVMLLLDQPGARTDFQMIQSTDWAAAADDNVYADRQFPAEWQENSWYDQDVTTIAGGIESWRYLYYFKPTDVFSHLDSRVTARSTDYRNPGTPVMAIGQGWFDLGEDTSSPSDFFNEGEAAYQFDLDQTLGLRFDLDGSGTPRHQPFFKVRQWRSLSPPANITVEGVTRSRDVDYRADVKPVSRALWAQNLGWHCDLESTVSTCVGANLDVGQSGAVNGTTPAAGWLGNAVAVTGNNQYIVADGSVNTFNAGAGAVEFFYVPGSPHTDGARRVLWMNTSGAGNDCFMFEKDSSNALVFSVMVDASNSTCSLADGTLYSVSVPSTSYNWQPGEWIHFRTSWNNSGLNRLQIWMNGKRLVGGANTFSAVGLTNGQTYFGGCPAVPGCLLPGGTGHANGIIDEPMIYFGGGATNPTRVAEGGLASLGTEYLGDTGKNFTFAFTPIDGSRRGTYLYLGADSPFRGLNVILQTPGAGVAADDLDWQYWNGGRWVTLETVTGFTDGTNSFTQAGIVFWTANPPTWTPYPADGGPLLYYVRVHLKATSAGYTLGFPQERLIKTDILLLSYCTDVTLPNYTFEIASPIPTAVDLSSFRARPGDGSVELEWETASELHNLGFHLYRSSSVDGRVERLTDSLIPGLGSSATGARYTWRDRGLENGVTYFYELEDVETTGMTRRHGPVTATPSKEAGAGAGGGGSGDTGDSGPGGPEDAANGRIRYGDPEGSSLRELERGPSHVVLELVTPGFEAIPEEGGTVSLAVAGFEEPAGSALALPVRRTLVPAAAGRRVRVASAEAYEEAQFAGLRLGPGHEAYVQVSGDGNVVRAGRRRKEAAGRAPGSSGLAVLVGTAFQGEIKKAEVELRPLRVMGGVLHLARRLVVRLEFFGREPNEVSLGGSAGRRLRVEPGRPRILAQLRVREGGLQGVRFEELIKGRRGYRAAALALSRLGQPVAFRVEPDGSRFVPGSVLHFLAADPGPTAESVYELRLGGEGVVMETAAAAPSGSPLSEYMQRRVFEENRLYQAGLLEAPDLWLWDLVVSPGSRSYPFTLDAVSASWRSGRLELEVQGASDFPDVAADHHLRVSINGLPVSELTWSGKTARRLEAELTPGLLRSGENTLLLENVADTGAAYSMVFLNRFAVTHPRPLTAEAGGLRGRFEESGRAEPTGFGGAASFVLDVTEASPRWLTGLEATGDGVAFRAEEGRSYLAVSALALKSPAVTRPPSGVLGARSNRADYLLVAPREFQEAARPLLELRRRQGLRARFAAVEAIADEFGHGESGPGAIAAFLRHAYLSWKRPSPRYVLLLGDATYDPADYLKTGVKDRVPTPLVRTSFLWTASDPAYAAVNGDDLLPDIAVGRLPAGSVEEARRLVAKVVAFETAGRGFGGRAVLVADNADAGGAFEANADQIAAGVLSGRDVEKLYLRALGSSTRAAILGAFDAGPALVSYLGHGGTAVWASENVLNNTDVPNLAPQAQQPLLLTLNCLNGFFHFPPFDSLAEALLKAEDRGAVAAFSPSGLSLNDPAHTYHQALLAEVSSGRHRRLGDAILAAQDVYAASGQTLELLSIFHLLGDPALSLH